MKGGGPSNITVWFRNFGHLRSNGEEGRSNTHRLPQIDHGKASAADRRRDVGDARGGDSEGSGGDAVGDDLYRKTAGNHGTVGGVTTNIKSVCRGEGLKGRWMQARGLVAQIGDIETALGHLGRSLAVS